MKKIFHIPHGGNVGVHYDVLIKQFLPENDSRPKDILSISYDVLNGSIYGIFSYLLCCETHSVMTYS
jgi:hypothetical protein